MEKIERVGSIIGIIVVCMLVFSVFAQIGLATEDEPGRSPNGLDDAGTVLADPEPGTNSGQINDDVAYDKYGLIYGTVVDQDGNTLASAYIHLDKISLTAATLTPPKYADCASSHVTFSNKEGYFHIKVLPGTYILKAGKGGYGTYISDIITVGSEGKEVDIFLKEAQDMPDQYGKLTGIVYGTTKKYSTAATLVAEKAELYKFPLSGASIQAIPEDGNNEYVQSTYTDENGKYELVLKVGVYKVTARVKNNQVTTDNTFNAVNNWYTQTITIKISSYVSQLDFLIILSENRYKTIEAINNGYIGAKLSIYESSQADTEDTVEIINYGGSDGVNIEPVTLASSKEVLRCTVSSESKIGKTVMFSIPNGHSSDYSVLYDDVPIDLADDLEDVLNPNNDDNHAEYYVTYETDETDKDDKFAIVYVSVSSFSEHTVAIISVGEIVLALGGPTAILIYVVCGAIAAVLFIIPAFKSTSPPIYYKKKKK